MSHHIMDCDIRNIQKYMKEIVKVDNSTQYQVSYFALIFLSTMNEEKNAQMIWAR